MCKNLQETIKVQNELLSIYKEKEKEKEEQVKNRNGALRVRRGTKKVTKLISRLTIVNLEGVNITKLINNHIHK